MDAHFVHEKISSILVGEFLFSALFALEYFKNISDKFA